MKVTQHVSILKTDTPVSVTYWGQAEFKMRPKTIPGAKNSMVNPPKLQFACSPGPIPKANACVGFPSVGAPPAQVATAVFIDPRNLAEKLDKHSLVGSAKLFPVRHIHVVPFRFSNPIEH
jgi:hypothetical protein